MKPSLLLASLAILLCSLSMAESPQQHNTLVVIEAEHFASQHLAEKRRWMIVTSKTPQTHYQDADSNHAKSASGQSYIELLPDTRVSHHDPLIHGESFADKGGQAAILSYPTYFQEAGKYTVWTRAFSTGSEDNGIHIGVNGKWPKTGARVQFCKGKHQWTWSSAQRTEKHHCGKPSTITLNIPSPGVHNVMVSMREDGFELDKLILSKDNTFTPSGIEQNETLAPMPALPSKTMLFDIHDYKRVIHAAHDFTYKGVGDVSFSEDNSLNALYIDTKTQDQQDTYAYAAYKADRKDKGLLDITLVTLGDASGASKYQVFLNDTLLGTVENPSPSKVNQEHYFVFKNITIALGDQLTVAAMAVSHTDANTVSSTTAAKWRALVLSRPKGITP